MASTPLSAREKNLLALCAAVLLLMGIAIIANGFVQRRSAAIEKIAALETQKRQNEVWLHDRAFHEKRNAWLVEKMPTTESLGRAQGQLLEDLQNQALELGVTIQDQKLPPDFPSTADYREVTVGLRVRGDQTVILQWLATMQSPEKFQVLKALEIELDSRAKEKTPQAVCNLTLARWFKPTTGL